MQDMNLLKSSGPQSREATKKDPKRASLSSGLAIRKASCHWTLYDSSNHGPYQEFTRGTHVVQ